MNGGENQRSAAPDNARAADPMRRVAVALDTADWKVFEAWCAELGPRVGVLKVGLEAYVRWGHRAVRRAAEAGGEVFLDLKLHDIPNTVAGAAAAARDLGVRYLTVHTAGGRAALVAAVGAAGPSLGILGVTVLTHLDAAALADLGIPGDPPSRVAAWANLAAGEGCAGVICSPLELPALRREHPRPFLLVTPGIRLAGTTAHDQRRVSTPAAAARAGADLLVVGRAITAAPDRDAALERLRSELAEGWGERKRG